jgi:hypothetical protein
VNCGELGEDYDRVYKVSFERMRENVLRFKDLAGDRCTVGIVLVDSRRDSDHMDRVREYWQGLGISLFYPSLMLNRGGTLEVDGMSYERYPEHALAQEIASRMETTPMCAAPFVFPFIGYDGQYYLCSSDWEKRVPLGSVFDASIASIMQAKMERVLSREPICRTCNHDPVNRITGALRGAASPAEPADVQQLQRTVTDQSVFVTHWLESLGKRATSVAPEPDGRRSRRIPVRAL